MPEGYTPEIDHEDKHVVTVPRWAMLECGGDARDAMVLAQITWWMQPSQRDGSPRTRHLTERDGHLWMYLTDAELAADLGMSLSQVQRARAALVKRGLIAAQSATLDGDKVTLVRPVDDGKREVAQSLVEPDEPSATSRKAKRDLAQSRARASSPCLNQGVEDRTPAADAAEAGELPGMPAPPSKPDRPHRANAEALAKAEWDAREAKPVCGYPALRERIEEALAANHSVEAVAAALPGMTVFSRNAFDMALRSARAAPNRTNVHRVVDDPEARARPSERLHL